jgi:hypothetical protein
MVGGPMDDTYGRALHLHVREMAVRFGVACRGVKERTNSAV